MIPSAVTLRLARSDDARAMAAMSRDLIEVGLGWRYSPARVAGLSRDPDTVALVACCGDTVAGFAIMQFGDERAHLTLLCVRPAHQRRGHGTHGSIEWLARVGARRRHRVDPPRAARRQRVGASAFYRTLGFGETITVPDYYATGIAAQRMVKLLRPSDGSA